MPLDDFLHMLHSNQSKPVIYRPQPRPPTRPKRDKSYEHKFYDVSHLNELISVLQDLPEDMDQEEKYQARYIVDTDRRMIFSREGRPGQCIPEHKQMASPCIAAGVIEFTKDYSKICCH